MAPAEPSRARATVRPRRTRIAHSALSARNMNAARRVVTAVRAREKMRNPRGQPFADIVGESASTTSAERQAAEGEHHQRNADVDAWYEAGLLKEEAVHLRQSLSHALGAASTTLALQKWLGEGHGEGSVSAWRARGLFCGTSTRSSGRGPARFDLQALIGFPKHRVYSKASFYGGAEARSRPHHRNLERREE
jgi:hypothetical protein